MTIQIETNSIVTVKMAADMLKRHRVCVYRWIRTGRIKSISIAGVIYVPVSEVERFKKELPEVDGPVVKKVERPEEL